MPTSADLLMPARPASAVCELPGLAAISASTVSDPVGSRCGADTAIECAASALRSTRTRGPTDCARIPQSSSSVTSDGWHSRQGFATVARITYFPKMDITPLHPVFAAELVGADLTRPPSDTLVETVEAAMAQFAVLVVRDARIDDEQHKRFSRAFGPLELPSRASGAATPLGKRQLDPDLFYAGNLDRDGEIIEYGSEAGALSKGAERFHTDSSFHAMPTKWSLLLGHEVPPSEAGGDT